MARYKWTCPTCERVCQAESEYHHPNPGSIKLKCPACLSVTSLRESGWTVNQ